MTRFRATLAYDGTHYHGYQIQNGVPTIQGEVEQVLERILGQPTTVYGAGRTDTGVHAVGQVIAFDADWPQEDLSLLRAINANLPEDIAVQTITQQPGFNPRFDALSRTYCYTIVVSDVRQPLLRQRAWQMRSPVDFNAMQLAAALIIGKHDFAAFGNPPQGTNTIREVFQSRWEVTETSFGQSGVYRVEATAFLQHMVRRLVGMMVTVGLGHLSVDDFNDIFQSKDLSRSKRLAPPQGLVLEAVSYSATD